jgi:hypothetical protein
MKSSFTTKPMVDLENKRIHIQMAISLLYHRGLSYGMVGLQDIFITSAEAENLRKLFLPNVTSLTPEAVQTNVDYTFPRGLRKQHRWLEDVDVRNVTKANFHSWLESLIEEHGEYLTITPLKV